MLCASFILIIHFKWKLMSVECHWIEWKTNAITRLVAQHIHLMKTLPCAMALHWRGKSCKSNRCQRQFSKSMSPTTKVENCAVSKPHRTEWESKKLLFEHFLQRIDCVPVSSYADLNMGWFRSLIRHSTFHLWKTNSALKFNAINSTALFSYIYSGLLNGSHWYNDTKNNF